MKLLQNISKFLLIALLCGVLPFPALAFFTDQEQSSDNMWSAGTLDATLDVTATSSAQRKETFGGETSTSPFDYSVGITTSGSATPGTLPLCTALLVTVTQDGNPIYSGPIAGFSVTSSAPIDENDHVPFQYDFSVSDTNYTYTSDCNVSIIYHAHQPGYDWGEAFYDTETDSFTLHDSDFGTPPPPPPENFCSASVQGLHLDAGIQSNLADGVLYTVASDGTAVSTGFDYPGSYYSVLAVGPNDDVLSIKENGALVELHTDGTITHRGTTTGLEHAVAMTFNKVGNLYVLDQDTKKLYQFAPSNAATVGNPSVLPNLDIAGGDIVSDYASDGLIYIRADGDVFRINVSTHVGTSLGSLGNGVTHITSAYRAGDTIYALDNDGTDSDTDGTRYSFDITGGTVSNVQSAATGPYQYGDGASCDPDATIPPETSGVVLNEILPNPEGDDSQGGIQGEWVEFYNNGSTPVDMTGWYITDNGGHVRTISSTNTYNGQTTIGILGSNSEWLVLLMNAQTLNNSGDTVTLYDANNVQQDSYTFTDSSTDEDSDSNNTPDGNNENGAGDETAGNEGKSYARIPDGTGKWVDPVPTPGGRNKLATTTEEALTANDLGLKLTLTGASRTSDVAFASDTATETTDKTMSGTSTSDESDDASTSSDEESIATTTSSDDVATKTTTTTATVPAKPEEPVDDVVPPVVPPTPTDDSADVKTDTAVTTPETLPEDKVKTPTEPAIKSEPVTDTDTKTEDPEPTPKP